MNMSLRAIFLRKSNILITTALELLELHGVERPKEYFKFFIDG